MFPKGMILVLATLVITSLACGISINLPTERINTGPVQTEEINILVPDTSEPVNLSIGFGAGELEINPGAQEALVEGTAEYNVPALKPEVSVDGDNITLDTGEMKIEGLPVFRDEYRNTWDLKLGDALMDLTVNAGAYKGNIELGGLSIQSLSITDGASEARWSFSQPNLVDMESLRYQTGASSISLEGLANTRADEITFKGGAGSYKLDFSGDLQREMTVNVDAGISNLEIVVPEGVSAQVNSSGGLSNVDVNGSWEKSGDVYTTPGEGPRITLNVNMGAGNVELRNR